MDDNATTLVAAINEYNRYLKDCWEQVKAKKASIYNSYTQHNLKNLVTAISQMEVTEREVIPPKYANSYVFFPEASKNYMKKKEYTPIDSKMLKQCIMEFHSTVEGVKATTSTGFNGATELSVIDLPNVTNVKSAGKLFAGCDSLREINLNSVVQLPNGFLQDSTPKTPSKLSYVSIANATTIGSSVFANQKSLTAVNMPNVTNIGGKAFLNCTALTSFYVQRYAQYGNYPFSGSGIQSLSVTIDGANSTKKTINQYAFNSMKNLSTLVFVGTPDGIKFTLKTASIGSLVVLDLTHVTTGNLFGNVTITATATYPLTIKIPNSTEIGNFFTSAQCKKLIRKNYIYVETV